MRTRFFLSVAWLIGCVVGTTLAQTPAATPSAPAPTTEENGTVPARPRYQQQSQAPQPRPDVPGGVAPPKQAPPPSPPPATPSEERSYPAFAPYASTGDVQRQDHDGSAYIPLDNWVYPAMTRLYSMGFLDTMFLGMRPWTRRSALHMLQASHDDIVYSNNTEAQEILAKLLDGVQRRSSIGECSAWNGLWNAVCVYAVDGYRWNYVARQLPPWTDDQ